MLRVLRVPFIAAIAVLRVLRVPKRKTLVTVCSLGGTLGCSPARPKRQAPDWPVTAATPHRLDAAAQYEMCAYPRQAESRLLRQSPYKTPYRRMEMISNSNAVNGERLVTDHSRSAFCQRLMR